MEILPRRVYTAECRQQPVARDGLSIAERARRMVAVLAAHQRTRATYGAARLQHELATVKRPSEVWTSDIIYVPTEEGRLYVAPSKDLFAGEVVGRAFSKRNDDRP